MPLAAPSLILAFRVLQPGVVLGAARRIAAATVEGAGCRAQHQRLHLCRMGDCVVQHGPAAHRLADQPHVGEFQMIDQGGKIVRIIGGIGAARHGIRRREAAMGEAHAGVARREMRDLLPPAQVIAAQAVGEQQGRAAARYFVVEIAERPLQPADRARRRRIGRHGWRPPQKRTSVEPMTPCGQRPAANRRNLLSKGEAAASANRPGTSWCAAWVAVPAAPWIEAFAVPPMRAAKLAS